MEFGSVLRKMRKHAGMSQEDIAEGLHIARSSISKLERNQLELRAADLINWCKITNHPEILMSFVYGADMVNSIIGTGATSLITGTITFLGGII